MQDSSTITTDPGDGPGFARWCSAWRGYLEIEIRSAQTRAREYERMQQAEQQRAASLRKQLDALGDAA